MPRVLITGSEGFIGRHLRARLGANEDLEIFSIDNKGSAPNHLTLDLKSKKLRHHVLSISPDIVVHLAGKMDVAKSISNPYESLINNAGTTVRLLQIASELKKVNFIYLNSGGATYYPSQPLPFSEGSLIRPISPYGISKQIGEDFLRITAENHQILWSSIALSNCFGDFTANRSGVISQFLDDIHKGKSSVIYGSNSSRDFIHVEDVIDAILLAIQNPCFRRVNISSNKEYYLMDVYRYITSLYKLELKPIVRESRLGELIRSRLDNTLAYKIWGWKPKRELYSSLSKHVSKEES